MNSVDGVVKVASSLVATSATMHSASRALSPILVAMNLLPHRVCFALFVVFRLVRELYTFAGFYFVLRQIDTVDAIDINEDGDGDDDNILKAVEIGTVATVMVGDGGSSCLVPYMLILCISVTLLVCMI